MDIVILIVYIVFFLKVSTKSRRPTSFLSSLYTLKYAFIHSEIKKTANVVNWITQY